MRKTKREECNIIQYISLFNKPYTFRLQLTTYFHALFLCFILFSLARPCLFIFSFMFKLIRKVSEFAVRDTFTRAWHFVFHCWCFHVAVAFSAESVTERFLWLFVVITVNAFGSVLSATTLTTNVSHAFDSDLRAIRHVSKLGYRVCLRLFVVVLAVVIRVRWFGSSLRTSKQTTSGRFSSSKQQTPTYVAAVWWLMRYCV